MKKTVFLRKAVAFLLALLLVMSQPIAAMAAYKTLKYGSRGTAVMEMQKALLSLGFDPNGTDGKFGSGTLAAVKAYQASRGLTVDGKAGNLTLTKLYAEASGFAGSSGSTADTSTGTLQYGSKGSRVTQLQQDLKTLGYYTGAVDGDFGAATKRAVIAFQSANKLTPDGKAGTKTLTMLAALLASGGSDNSSNTGSNSGSSSSGSSSADTSGLTRTLRRGYTGDDVIKVQNRLKELGYYTKEVDGVYGLGSMAAVKAFQQNNGLTADGLAGKATFAVLFSSSAITAGGSAAGSTGSSGSSSGNTDNSGSSGNTGTSDTTAYPRLSKGSKGEEVSKMQSALLALNYPIYVDGDFGAATEAAVKLFQGVNGLDCDGVAGSVTLSVLYGGNAKPYTGGSNSSNTGSGTVGSSAGAAAMGTFTASNGKTIQLLHWTNEIKPYLKTGQNLTVYDPATTITFTLYVMSRGRHCDVEPLTADDTAKMMQAWGGVETWTPRAVCIGLPDGRWTLAVMHNVAHGSQVIGSSNNFDGQNCVHFLRDMSETILKDPDYGVTNQNALRKAWKQYTGVTVD